MARKPYIQATAKSDAMRETLAGAASETINEAIERAVPEPVNPFVTNITDATTVHLGDGRKLLPGESLLVNELQAVTLRATGFVA